MAPGWPCSAARTAASRDSPNAEHPDTAQTKATKKTLASALANEGAEIDLTSIEAMVDADDSVASRVKVRWVIRSGRAGLRLRNMPARLVLSVAVAATLTLTPGTWTPTTEAHCPGGNVNHYAAGLRTLSELANGIAGDIQWTQGNVCSSGVSHSVGVCKVNASGECAKWAQVGWRYYDGYAEPKGYCEWAGAQYKLVEFTISHATHRYKQLTDTVDKFWECYSDGNLKFSWSFGNAGFSTGTELSAQGEAHSPHVQIGKVAPAALLFSDMQYRRASNWTWPAFDVAQTFIVPANAPYGASEPVFGQLHVWTNAH